MLIFNKKATAIPKGCYFGPYRGKTFSPKEYATVKESGYAWEVLDSANKIRVVGFVDPGPDPDEKLEWLALVNSANFKSELISIISTGCSKLIKSSNQQGSDFTPKMSHTYPVFRKS